MLKRQTVVDQIEITRDGVVQVRFTKEVVDDATGEVIATNYHRTAFPPGVDVDMQVLAVNAHLKQMGEEMVPFEGLANLRAVIALIHKPAVVAAYKAGIAKTVETLLPKKEAKDEK